MPQKRPCARGRFWTCYALLRQRAGYPTKTKSLFKVYDNAALDISTVHLIEDVVDVLKPVCGNCSFDLSVASEVERFL